MTMLDISDGMYTAPLAWHGMIRQNTTALLAATFPIKPPRHWFDNPTLRGPTPLTIQSDGHVFGHIATWKQSHIGMIGQVKAPRSKAGYGFYATGAVECDDGSLINVGQITLTGGHAPLEASVAEAVAHYDDTRSAWCDVAVGEDDIGVWVAGSLRPDINDIQLRAIRASSVSGDWRPINGNLELVAVCGVNVPGFPIARARVASGQVVALVAAGTEELVTISMLDQLGVDVKTIVSSATEGIDRRLALVEDALLDRVRDRREGLTAAVENSSTDIAELRARVRPPAADETVIASLRQRARPPEVVMASLRERVRPLDETWEDGMSIDMPLAECLQASLRAKVKAVTAGGMTATATSTWKADKRKEAAGKGQALPDGSYPIKDKTDWRKARQALGRAKNRAKVVRHLKKRGRSLGIPKEELDRLHASAVPFPPTSAGNGLTAGVFTEALHPRGHDGKWIEKFGIVELLGLSKYNGQHGRVVDIKPGDGGDKTPNIMVEMGDDGHLIKVKPKNVKQAPQAKGRLFNPDAGVFGKAAQDRGMNVPEPDEDLTQGGGPEIQHRVHTEGGVRGDSLREGEPIILPDGSPGTAGPMVAPGELDPTEPYSVRTLLDGDGNVVATVGNSGEVHVPDANDPRMGAETIAESYESGTAFPRTDPMNPNYQPPNTPSTSTSISAAEAQNHPEFTRLLGPRQDILARTLESGGTWDKQDDGSWKFTPTDPSTDYGVNYNPENQDFEWVSPSGGGADGNRGGDGGGNAPSTDLGMMLDNELQDLGTPEAQTELSRREQYRADIANESISDSMEGEPSLNEDFARMLPRMTDEQLHSYADSPYYQDGTAGPAAQAELDRRRASGEVERDFSPEATGQMSEEELQRLIDAGGPGAIAARRELNDRDRRQSQTAETQQEQSIIDSLRLRVHNWRAAEAARRWANTEVSVTPVPANLQDSADQQLIDDLRARVHGLEEAMRRRREMAAA